MQSNQAVDALPFEQKIVDLEKKIRELKELSDGEHLDLGPEIEKLSQKLARLREDTYQNISAWEVTQIARHPQRPYTLDYIRNLFTDFVEMHGGRQFYDDNAIVGGMARFNGEPVVVIGHEKGRGTDEKIFRNFGMPHPEGYRKALRLMQFANKFQRPLVLFIDTPGAYPGKEAEERGQGEAIARNIFDMSFLKVPVLVIVIGEGGSGGAVALGVGDRVLMLEHSIYSVISPEGCASILWKDVSKSKDAANALKITSRHLQDLGIIDGIIPEPLGGAHYDHEKTYKAVREAISKNLAELKLIAPDLLVEQRFEKYAKMGVFVDEGHGA
ncbi:MAG: acetyl-CoA carboxylase carboxyltransferase subunit alpha [Candidatus Cloacimonetes bacterium]|nr:acetyl-CoA carboxylase carboxyltransferase subunit alpha [Candidatus Cloacimonadota bacterium]